MEMYKFKAVPTAERYYNEDSNWGVYVFTTSEDIPKTEKNFNDVNVGTLAGKVQKLTLGLEYEVTASLEFNKKYNSFNYVPQTVSAVQPKSQEQQIAFLKTQVTETQAENILSVYPNVVEDTMNGKDIDYTKIKGVGEITWNKIREKIIGNYVISDILALLQPLGITITTISKLLSYEKNPILLKQMLIDDPYIITKAGGIGFKKADDTALKLNPEIRVSEKRVKAFVRWFLKHTGDETGDTWVTHKTLDNAVRDNINECYEIYEDFLDKQCFGNGMLTMYGDKIGLHWICDMEHSVLEMLDKLNNAKFVGTVDVENGIISAEKAQGFLYTEEQKTAIKKCCDTNVVFISGQAGTGKSTILRGLINIYNMYNIACCALSAKAAQRITEATGHSASTIHRLLEYKDGEFTYGENEKLPYDVIVLDEASMVNAEIFHALLKAIKAGSKVIICGDDGQLPPIGCGNVFHDLLKSGIYNCCKLTKILRQAERSGIISDSRKIRHNEFPVQSPESKIVTGELQDMTYVFRQDREKMRDMAIKLYLKTAKEYGIDNTIIITPCKQNRINSTEEINMIIQNKLLPYPAESIAYGKKEFRVGAKVIQRVNNYDKNVFNGETGKILSIDKQGKVNTVTVLFSDNKKIVFTQSELASLELAYALTVHVTQGSGYDNVIVLIDNTHFKLLDSCLLYTAVTRAKKKCLIIAEPTAFERCIKNKASVRKTWLSLT